MARSPYEIAIAIGGRINASLSSAVRDASAQVGGLENIIRRTSNSPVGGAINPEFGKSVSTASSQVTGLGANLKKMAGIAAGAFAAIKIKDAFVDAVDVYKNYEQAIAQTAATAGIEKGSEDYIKLQNAAREAGKATTKTAKEAADALGYMSLAGWDVEQSTKGLMPILRLSEATQADLALTSDLVTDSMSALGISVDGLPKYLDVATMANNKSNQTAIQMMEAYVGVGGTLKRLETPIEESAALLGVMANRGDKGSEAGTGLSSTLINLTKKSGESAKAMEALGLNAYDSEGKFKGVTNVLKELNNATKDLTAEQRDTYLTMIGGKNNITTLNSLMDGLNTVNADGVSELEALQKQLENSTGSLDKMADAVSNTMTGAFARMSSAIDDFKIGFVEGIEPYITPVINKISEKIPIITESISTSLKKGSTLIKNFGIALKDLDADAVNQISISTGLDEEQVNTIVNVANTAIKRIKTVFDGFRKIFAGDSISGATDILQVLGFNEESIQTIFDFCEKIKTPIQSISESIAPTIQIIKSAVEKIAPVLYDIVNFITQTILPRIGSAFEFLTDNVAQPFVSFFQNNIPKIAEIFVNIWDIIKPIVSVIANVFSEIATAIGPYLSEFIQNILALASEIITIFEGITNFVAGVFTGDWSRAWEGVKTIFDGFFSALKTIAIAKINHIVSAINKFKIKVPDISILPESIRGKEFGFNIPQIPQLANGGIVTSPTLSMVGEGGENEVIFPLSKLENFLKERNNPINQNSNTPNISNSSEEAFKILYSPKIIIQGNADKQEIEKAILVSKEEFDKMMREWTKQHGRIAFGR